MSLVNPNTGRTMVADRVLPLLHIWLDSPRVQRALATRITNPVEMTLVRTNLHRLNDHGLWKVVQWVLKDRRVRLTVQAVYAQEVGRCAAMKEVKSLRAEAEERIELEESVKWGVN